MIINVGSKNPNKLRAVEEAFLEYRLFKDIKVIPFEKANSGVSNQPMGNEETLMGARNRALDSFHSCDFSVGLESGLVNVPLELTETGYMNVTFCVIYDGTDFFCGMGSGFELPRKAVDLILLNKMEVDQAVHTIGLTNNPRIGYNEGIISILTNGAVNRIGHAKSSVYMALARMYEKYGRI